MMSNPQQVMKMINDVRMQNPQLAQAMMNQVMAHAAAVQGRGV